jgi:hypothetical protein
MFYDSKMLRIGMPSFPFVVPALRAALPSFAFSTGMAWRQ